MLTTAEQARELWCPMVRLPTTVGDTDESPITATNVHVDGRRLAAHRCIAEKCAMWRWMGGAKTPLSFLEPLTIVKSNFGHCGLASRPEVTT